MPEEKDELETLRARCLEILRETDREGVRHLLQMIEAAMEAET